ncbi:MAG: phosphoribosyltransferase [Solirubrobacterales bacterium]|nr:phosphoribosyltransferase [Solirubrobacterales bacterium]
MLAPSCSRAYAAAISGQVKPRFADRRDGGRHLAGHLTAYAGRDDVVVLGLPRGGVPVAGEVANALEAPLDVFVVRKLGVPGHEELAMGAIASGAVRVLNEDVVAATRVPEEEVERVTERELETLTAQEHAYRGERSPVDVRDRIAIVVDDGLATGATMRAAVTALRQRGARRIVVAVPTAPRETCRALRRMVDEVVCATTPDPFMAVGLWYANFAPVSDDQVRELLGSWAASSHRARSGGAPPAT